MPIQHAHVPDQWPAPVAVRARGLLASIGVLVISVAITVGLGLIDEQVRAVRSAEQVCDLGLAVGYVHPGGQRGQVGQHAGAGRLRELNHGDLVIGLLRQQ